MNFGSPQALGVEPREGSAVLESTAGGNPVARVNPSVQERAPEAIKGEVVLNGRTECKQLMTN